MKKLLLLFAVLCSTVSVWAQIHYGKKTWTFPATESASVTEVPEKIFSDFVAAYPATETTPATELTPEKVGVYTTRVRVNTAGDVTATFVYNGGNIRMDISGIDLVNANGDVAYRDYHFGYAGSSPTNNTYTLSDVTVGDYILRLFIAAQKEDVTSANNDSRGTVTLSGAWLYPNGSTASDKNFYYIKNVRSEKYVSNRGEGTQFAQQSNIDAGAYWYFVEADVEDMNNVTSIPEGYKAYWLYSAANELPVENPQTGRFAAVDASPYPGKIYYVGVHSKDSKTGLVIRPYNEDAASWNDNQGAGTAVANHSYDDAGSLWSFEVANMTEAELKTSAETAKTNATTALANARNAYYVNPLAIPATVETDIDNIDVSTLEKACRSLIAGSAEAIVTEALNNSRITPAAGDRFIMKNKGRANGYLRAYATGVDVKASALGTDVSGLDLVWTLVGTETDGEFKIYNERQGVYVGTLPTYNNSKMQYTTDASSAGIYEVSQNGIYTLFHAKGQNATGYIHMSNWAGKEIVRWDNGDASQWQLFKAPFELTTDAANPICYAIKSARGNYYFTLDNNKVKLYNNKTIATDQTTHWFFMLDADKNLKIYPFTDKENSVGYVTVADESGKLTNNHSAESYLADTYTLYFNENNSANYGNMHFALRPTSGNTYVSNYGGTNNYMGFYNNFNDHGTRIAFEEISGHVLQQKITLWQQYLEHKGTGINQYNIQNPEGIKAKIDDVSPLLSLVPSGNADFVSALNELNDFEFPAINQPETGKFYCIKSMNGASEQKKGKYLYNAAPGEVLGLKAERDASCIIYLESDYSILSYKSGVYWHSWQKSANIGAKGCEWTILENGAIRGTYAFKHKNENRYLSDWAATDKTSEATNNDNQSAWAIEHVESLPVNIGETGYATFFAPVAVTLPSGLKAYYVSEAANTSATMTEIESVIPANTGVILQGTAGTTYELNITDENINDAVESKLSGTVAATYVQAAAYVLAKPADGEVGLYKATLNKNENGETGDTHFLNNGFKAYLPANAVTAAGARILFDFGTETAIESIQGAESADAVVYDLAGRRVKGAQKGLYIVNGKVVVK